MAGAAVHFAATAVLGWAFMAMGWSQLVLGVLLLLHPHTLTRRAVAAVNLLAVASWAMSRTVGLPFAGSSEAIGLADTVAVGLELGAVVAAARRFGRRGAHAAPPLSRRGAVAVSGVAAVLALGGSSLAVADMGGHGGGGHDEQGAAPNSGTEHGDAGGSAHGMTAASTSTDMQEVVHDHGQGRLHLHGVAEGHLHQQALVHLHEPDEASPRPAPAGESDGAGGHPKDHKH